MRKRGGKILAALCLAAYITALFGGLCGAENASSQVRSVNHRGYNSVAPENTIPAFKLSKANGFTWVETDISFTKDGVPVLLHDQDINRTARRKDGGRLKKRLRIADIEYEDLLEYDFGIWKGAEYRGTEIPTLEAFLRFCAEEEMCAYLELKDNGAYTREEIGAAVDMVHAFSLRDRVAWISFDLRYLEWVRDRDPEARLGILEMLWLGPGSVAHTIEKAKRLQTGSNRVFVDAPYALVLLYEDCVRMFRDAGIPLEVYSVGTVDDPEALGSLDEYISGATTNIYRYEDLIRARISGNFYSAGTRERKNAAPGIRRGL